MRVATRRSISRIFLHIDVLAYLTYSLTHNIHVCVQFTKNIVVYFHTDTIYLKMYIQIYRQSFLLFSLHIQFVFPCTCFFLLFYVFTHLQLFNVIHKLLLFKSGKRLLIRKERKVRKIKSTVPAEFSNDILNSELTKPLSSYVNDIVSKYNDVLLDLLDKHVPTKLRPLVQRLPQPWMNAEIPEAKRVRRRYERRWRKSPLAVH